MVRNVVEGIRVCQIKVKLNEQKRLCVREKLCVRERLCVRLPSKYNLQ